MVATVETEKIATPPQVQENLEYIPETPQIPEHIEKGGVAAVPSSFTAQVADDSGQPMIQTPQSSVTITIPGDENYLENLAKGPANMSLTWHASFWLKMIKKAVFNGWKILIKK